MKYNVTVEYIRTSYEMYEVEAVSEEAAKEAVTQAHHDDDVDRLTYLGKTSWHREGDAEDVQTSLILKYNAIGAEPQIRLVHDDKGIPRAV